MNQRIEQVSKWFYRGLWGVLTKWFRVPEEPPQLPAFKRERIQSFRPADGFLKYLKFQFWLLFTILDGFLLLGWVAMTIATPWLGMALAPLALALIVVPDVLVYLAIHLRFDTTWYVMSDRSLRIRRGIWIIHETTITFENVQNVTVNQGPVQRYFGIADVRVQTAGGGGGQAEGDPMGSAHHGVIEGVANAQEIRDLIMRRLKMSRTAGLGDDSAVVRRRPTSTWSAEHLSVLREVREAARQLG